MKTFKRWLKLRTIADHLLFYLSLACQCAIAILANVSTYLIFQKYKTFIINTFITTGAIIIGVVNKIQKENKTSMDSIINKRIEVMESMCDLEVIRDPTNQGLIEKWYQAQVDLIKIDKQLLRKRNVITNGTLRKGINEQDNESNRSDETRDLQTVRVTQ